jgi:hypothetical protein
LRDVSVNQLDRTQVQKHPLGTRLRTQADERSAEQNGGSARGYQELSARLAIPTTAEQAGGQAVCLCIASAGRECALLPRFARRSSVDGAS